MEAQNMKVNPRELVIDLPLDEANVLVKMESMAQLGQVEDVTIRLQDMRIINGFHRVEAATRMGWDSIDARVVELDDEAFWDARIQAARQHHRIEGERLLAWMMECWKQTKWHVNILTDQNGLLPRAYSNTSVDLQMVEMIWTIFVKKTVNGYQIADDTLTDEERELLVWLNERAKQWNVSARDLADKLLIACGIRRDGQMADTYDQYARHYNLNLKQTLRLQREILRRPGKNSAPSWEVTDAFVEEKVIGGIEDGEKLYEFSERKFKEALEADRAREAEANKEKRVLANDPAYQKHLADMAAKVATSRVKDDLRKFYRSLRQLKYDLLDSPQGNELLAAFISDVAELRRELFPQTVGDKTDGFVDRVSELKRKLTDAQREIQDLRRDLNRANSKSPRVMAMSSTEIESMVA